MKCAVLKSLRSWAVCGPESVWGPCEGGGRAGTVGHPGCLVEKIAFEPAGFGPQTLQSPPRRQQAEEA